MQRTSICAAHSHIAMKTFNTFVLLTLLAAHCVAAPDINDIRAASVPVMSNGRLLQHAAVFVNGRAVRFDTDLAMHKGRLQVPLRAISEAAGAVVNYDAPTRTISIQRGTRVVQIHTAITPRVLVPLRFISENLGAEIEVNTGTVNGILEVYVNWPEDNFAPPEVVKPPVETPVTPPVTTPPAPSRNTDTAIYAAIQHNLNQLNAYRAKAGAQALQLDPKLNQFAQKGSLELKQNHQPHGHFQRVDVFESGFSGGAAENQGDPNGWPIRGGLNATIDAILQAMINEGPGGGHHDNMLNPKFRRVGIGLVVDGDKLYLTNDFSQ